MSHSVPEGSSAGSIAILPVLTNYSSINLRLIKVLP
jgi:hypothetical protein